MVLKLSARVRVFVLGFLRQWGRGGGTCWRKADGGRGLCYSSTETSAEPGLKGSWPRRWKGRKQWLVRGGRQQGQPADGSAGLGRQSSLVTNKKGVSFPLSFFFFFPESRGGPKQYFEWDFVYLSDCCCCYGCAGFSLQRAGSSLRCTGSLLQHVAFSHRRAQTLEHLISVVKTCRLSPVGAHKGFSSWGMQA